jgi:hypothetical protein
MHTQLQLLPVSFSPIISLKVSLLLSQLTHNLREACFFVVLLDVVTGQKP